MSGMNRYLQRWSSPYIFVTVVSMNDTKRLLELALKGLETERARIQEEIAEIESQIRGSGARQPKKGNAPANSI